VLPIGSAVSARAGRQATSCARPSVGNRRRRRVRAGQARAPRPSGSRLPSTHIA
jgi:hypothetical protein